MKISARSMKVLFKNDLKPQNLEIGIVLLKAKLGRKSQVIRTLRELHIPIAIDANYKTIINELNKNDFTKTFISRYFPQAKCTTFNGICDSFAVECGFHLLRTEEFQLAAKWLREHGHQNLALNRKGSRQDQVNQIFEEVTPVECINALRELAITKAIKPVQQNGRWVRGIFGVQISTVSRKSSEVEDLVRMLEKIPTNCLAQFADQLGLNKEKSTWGKQDHPEFRFSLYQVTLTYIQNDKILKAFNNLLALHIMEVDKTEILWGIIITSFGVFERHYDGEEELAKILLKTIPEIGHEVSKEGLNEGSLPLRVMAYCLLNEPNTILDNLYGLPQLRSLSQELGLVRTDEARAKSELIDVLILRLGFVSPPELIGLKSYRELLEKHDRSLRGVNLLPINRRGIMIDAYARTERVLKDLLLFYVSVLLKVQKNFPVEIERQIESAEKFVKRDLDFKFSPDEMNIGQLIQALSKLNKLCAHDKEFADQLQSHFGRNQIFNGELEPIESILGSRKYFGHDAKGKKKIGEVPDNHECIKILSKMLEFAKLLNNNSVYPRLIRIISDIRDQYGRHYVDATDEEGSTWRIKSDEFPQIESVYFMQPLTDQVTMYPLLIEKLS